MDNFKQLPAAAIDIPLLAKALLAAGGRRELAREIAERRGDPDRVKRLLTGAKAAIGAGTTTDDDFGSVLSDQNIAAQAFFSSLRAQSVFFRLLDGGSFRRVPMRTRIGTVTAGATAFIVGEGKPTPISKLALANGQIAPQKAAAIIVVTDETARAESGAAQGIVTTELRAAVSNVVDAAFFATVIDGSTPSTPSAGPTADGMRTDLRTLLDFVNTKATGTLFWAMDPGTANRASLIEDPRAAMTPIGGELLGLPALVSDVIPAGTLRLINAASIAADAENIELDVSREATLEMSTTPTNASDVPTHAEMVSLFQDNSVAMLARVTVAVERLRDNAIAEITGIAWE